MDVGFLGATKGMGRALARLMAERGDRLCLLGRDPDDLERSARDLEARGATGEVAVVKCDLEDHTRFAGVLSEARAAIGGLDIVVVTAGMFASQEALEEDPVLTERLLRLNFSNTVLFCEAARKALLEEGGGTLCVFSSVAGQQPTCPPRRRAAHQRTGSSDPTCGSASARMTA